MPDPVHEDGPLVSIIVRTHGKRGGFLAEALRSIAAQTYRPIEVVVVEDGPATSHAALQEIRESSLSVIHRAIPQSGRCAAGNVGLAAATGQFLGFLDDDDLLLPHHVDALVQALTSGSDSVAACARSLVVPTEVRSLDPLVYEATSSWEFRFVAPFSRWRLWAKNQFPIQACLFRRELYDTFGGFDEMIPVLEDWELWIRYLSDGHVEVVDQVTSLFRLPRNVAEMHSREVDLARLIDDVHRAVGAIAIRTTPADVLDASRLLLVEQFEESRALTFIDQRMLAGRGWRRLLGRVLVGVVGALRRVRRIASEKASPSKRADALASAALKPAPSQDRDFEVQIAEARQALSIIWRTREPDRFVMLGAFNAVAGLFKVSGPLGTAVRAVVSRSAVRPYGSIGEDLGPPPIGGSSP